MCTFPTPSPSSQISWPSWNRRKSIVFSSISRMLKKKNYSQVELNYRTVKYLIKKVSNGLKGCFKIAQKYFNYCVKFGVQTVIWCNKTEQRIDEVFLAKCENQVLSDVKLLFLLLYSKLPIRLVYFLLIQNILVYSLKQVPKKTFLITRTRIQNLLQSP
ncbi:hypothetical protein EGR_02410 [Echinococcus granulosus]|uniref:Uncharacterized protein n=1 Tax=Echinococcus granulosus TaxID=6210 RepID=W6V801_ECHGR|nr:hypothetical protein EGR_02410 [Echinococcus granulosus]EUB62614.1 hypothetical protein EGR_02410 [Echinococcus granulosus]